MNKVNKEILDIIAKKNDGVTLANGLLQTGRLRTFADGTFADGAGGII